MLHTANDISVLNENSYKENLSLWKEGTQKYKLTLVSEMQLNSLNIKNTVNTNIILQIKEINKTNANSIRSFGYIFSKLIFLVIKTIALLNTLNRLVNRGTLPKILISFIPPIVSWKFFNLSWSLNCLCNAHFLKIFLK